MKTTFSLVTLFLALTSLTFTIPTESDDNKAQLQQELQANNSRIEQLYLKKDVNAVVALFDKTPTFFPEYKPGIFETNKIKAFFTGWFDVADIKAYKKNIYLVEEFDGYLLEIGTFKMNYALHANQEKEFTGKYMVLWKRDTQKELKIVSEAFGADKYIEAKDVPYVDVKVELSNFLPDHHISQQLEKNIEDFDAVVLSAVAGGDSEARANGFTQDGILMPNFDSIHEGMYSIREHMVKTYRPDISFNVKHTYSRIYDLGDYVLLSGHYRGGWGDTTNGGWFEGKMSNFMKKTKDGKLLMHRQLGNRDSNLIIYD